MFIIARQAFRLSASPSLSVCCCLSFLVGFVLVGLVFLWGCENGEIFLCNCAIETDIYEPKQPSKLDKVFNVTTESAKLPLNASRVTENSV